jgi:hypothetical protein
MNKTTAFLDTVFTTPVEVISGFRPTSDTALGQFIENGHVYNFVARRDGEIYWNEDSEATTYVQNVISGYLDAKGIHHDSSMGLPYDVLQGYSSYRTDRIGGVGKNGPKQGRCPAGKAEVRAKSGTVFCRKLRKGSGSPLKAGEAFEEMGGNAPEPRKKGMSKAGKIALGAAIGVPLVAGGALALDKDAREAGKKMIGSVKGGIKGFGEDLEPIGKNLEDKSNDLTKRAEETDAHFNKMIEEQEKTIADPAMAKYKKGAEVALKEMKQKKKEAMKAIGDEANASLKENLGAVGSLAKSRTKEAGAGIKSAGSEYLAKKKQQIMNIGKKKKKEE